MKQAKSKVWLTADNKLVKDGDPDAKVLFAAEGQVVPDEYLKGFSNASTFFGEENPKHPEPNIPAPRVERFEPGQSNSPPSGGLEEKRSGVKTIGQPSAIQADAAAGKPQKGQGTLAPEPQKGQGIKGDVKSNTKSTAKKTATSKKSAKK